MTSALRWMFALVVVLFLASPSYAQTAASPSNFGQGLGMGLSIVGLGLGLGLIGFSALSSIARQPEQAGKIQGLTILLAALLEGAAIISLVLCLVTLVL